MKRPRGFTIVEIAVVVMIISVLATITILAYNRTMSNSRNDSAKSRTQMIANALEKYYSANGEYPTCTQLTQSSSVVASTYLPGIDPNSLTRDGSGLPAGTNSISCSAATTTNFAYTSTTTSFSLSYVEEVTGTTVTVTGQH